MSDIVVHLPNGRGRANFPAGTPPEKIEAAIAELLAPSLSEGVARSFGSGTLGNAGDEATAAVRAALPEFSNWMMKGPALERDPSIGGSPTPQTVSTAPTYEGRYDEELTRERQKGKDFRTAYPKTDMAANAAGMLSSTALLAMLPGIGPLITGGGAKTLPGAMVRGAASGGLLGGGAGFAEGEGDSRIGEAKKGAAIGAGAGLLLPPVVAGVGAGYNYIAPKVLGLLGITADKLAPKAVPASLSAAAPEGGPGIPTGLLADVADNSRAAADKIRKDIALGRLGTEIERSGGLPRVRAKQGELGDAAMILDSNEALRRLANVGYIMPGDAADKYIANFAAREGGTGKRFLGAMGDQAKVPPIADAQRFLKAYKTQTGSDLYDPVLRGGKFNVSDELAALTERPSVKKALETVDGWAVAEGKALTEGERFHMVKQALNKNADAAMTGGVAVNKKMVGDTATEWERALWKANPGIQEADTAYAKIASLSDPKGGDGWLQRGGGFLKQGQSQGAVEVSPAALAADLPKATPEQLQAFRVGSSNVMRDTAMSGPEPTRALGKSIITNDILKDKLRQIYSPEFLDQLLKTSTAERTFAQSGNRVTQGSPSAQRLVSLADEVSQLPSSSASPISWLQLVIDKYKSATAPNEQTRSILADLLATPDKTTNAQTLLLVEELLKRRAGARPLQSGASGLLGVNAGDPSGGLLGP